MKNCRVIIVSNSSLFVDAVSRLLQKDEIQVVTCVNSVEETQLALNKHPIDSIVVDYDDPQLSATDTLINNFKTPAARRIVYLSLADNEMTFHYQERIENITPAELIKAICFLVPTK